MTEILRVGLLSPVEHFDPHRGTDFANLSLRWHIFDTPYRPMPEGDETEAVLFTGPLTSVPGSPEAMAYSAEVRPGIFFSDGTELKPRHVVESLSQSPAFASHADVEVVGQRVVFRLKRPHARFDWVLCNHYCSIVLERGGKFLGTGAYVPRATDPEPSGDSRPVTLVRNRHHPNPPAIEEIQFDVYPVDSDGRPRRLIEAIHRGDVDFTEFLSREDQKDVKGVRKWMGAGESTALLHFNTTNDFLADAEVRQAAALCLDRKVLAAASYQSPLAFAATGWVPPRLAMLADAVHPDLDKARQLLAGKTLPVSPLRMVVVHIARPYLPHPMRTAGLIVEQLEQIGLRVEVSQARDVGDYLERTSSGDYDLFLGGWIPDSPDLVEYFEALFASDAIPDEHQSAVSRANLSRWQSPAMDEAILEYRQRPEYKQLLDIGSILDGEMPLVALLCGPKVVVHSWRIKSRPVAFHSRPFFAEMHF